LSFMNFLITGFRDIESTRPKAFMPGAGKVRPVGQIRHEK